MTNRLRLIVMLTAMLAIAASASAQIAQPTFRSSRPARGLFGGGVGDTSQSLILTGSIGGGIDKAKGKEILDGSGVPTGETAPWTGGYATAATGLAYNLSLGRVHAGAAFDVGARYRDNQINNNKFNAIGASANIGWEIGPRTSLSASQGFSRQPRNIQSFYGGWFDAESSPSTVFDLSGATSLSDYTTSQSAVTFSQGITDRIALNAGYSYYTYGSGGVSDIESRTSTAAAGISYQIARGISFRIGYGTTEAKYGASDPVRYGGVVMDGGLVFDRALSLTRRTSLSFSTGLTGARDEGGHTHYYVTARGTLNYEIGRSWTAALNYRRGVDFNQNLGQPMVMDMVSAGVSGDLSRRFHVSTAVASSWGAIGIATGNGFNSTSATANLRTAITRQVGASLRYAYGHYLVDDSTVLPLGMRPGTDRQSIRATIDVWIPLFTRARRPDASR